MLELFQPIFKGEERPPSEDANFCFLYLQSSFSVTIHSYQLQMRMGTDQLGESTVVLTLRGT